MSLFTILMVILLIGSITFFLLTLSRVFLYDKKYKFPELTYTKLFGVFDKKHVCVAHGTFTILHVIFTIWFLWTL